MATLALRLPTAEGAKVTMNEQLAAAASEVPQVLLVREKSLLLVPVTLGALVIDRLALPVFVRVTVCPCAEVPTNWLPKVRVVEERPTAGAVPVPVRVNSWGLPAALSVKTMLAVRLPEVLGVNVALIVQLAPCAREVPQVLVSVKSPELVPDT